MDWMLIKEAIKLSVISQGDLRHCNCVYSKVLYTQNSVA